MNRRKALHTVIAVAALIAAAAAVVSVIQCTLKNNKDAYTEESSGNELPEDPEITLSEGLPADGSHAAEGTFSGAVSRPAPPVPGEISIQAATDVSGAD